jgi:hypothetical protein
VKEFVFQKEQLQLSLSGAAEWRRQRAIEHPDDQRNLEAILDRLAHSVDDIDPILLGAFIELYDDPEAAEAWGELVRQVGFESSPGDVAELVREFIAHRAGIGR